MKPPAAYYVCPSCACPDVEIQVWTRANDDKYDGGEAGSYNWCPACESDFKYLDEIDNPHRFPLRNFRALHSVMLASRADSGALFGGGA